MRGSCWACICSLAVALGACANVVPRPTLDDGAWAAAQWPGENVATLSRGRDLYVDKCGGCHGLYAPTAMPTSRWPTLVDDMVENAHLQPHERDLIVHYLLGASRARPSASAGGALIRHVN